MLDWLSFRLLSIVYIYGCFSTCFASVLFCPCICLILPSLSCILHCLSFPLTDWCLTPSFGRHWLDMAHFYWPLVFPIVSFCLSFPSLFLQLHSNLPCNAPTLQCRWSLLAYLTPHCTDRHFSGTKHKTCNKTKHGAHISRQPAVCQCPHKIQDTKYKTCNKTKRSTQ